MEKYAHPEKEIRTAVDCRKRMGDVGGKMLYWKLKIGKITGEKCRIVHKTSTIEKIAVDNKKIPGKKWGISCE